MERKRILLVEDELITAIMEKRLLEKNGYEVEHANSGEKAINILQNHSHPFHLILMDINLGSGLDGTETAALILEKMDIPIVFLSSHTEIEIVEKTEQITSYGNIVKNSNETVFLASLKMAFKLFEAKMEAKRHENELTKFKEISDNGLFGQAISDMDGKLLYVNHYFAKIHGYTKDFLIGKNLSIFHNSSQMEQVKYLINLLESKGSFNDRELWHTHKNGHIFPMLMSGILLKDTFNKKDFMAVTAVDVTSLKKTEILLKKERDLSDTYINLANVIFISLDNTGTIKMINKKACQLLKWDKEDLIGKNWFDFCIPPTQRDFMRSVFFQILNGFCSPHEYFENYVMDKEGTEYLIRWHNTTLYDSKGEVSGSLSSGEDITEQRKNESYVRDYENLLKTTQKISKVGGWEWDVHKQTMTWTEETVLIHGLEKGLAVQNKDSLINLSIECYNPEDRDNILKAFYSCLDKGIPYDFEVPFTDKKGKKLWVRTAAQAIWHNNQIIKVMGNLMDITERKQHEELIKKQLQEKELLVKEVFHRVKNNILSIEALLSLQAQNHSNKEVKSVLYESVNHIKNMRIIYEKMLQTNNYQDVSIKTYLNDLIFSVTQAYQDFNDIDLLMELDDFSLPAKIAINLGFIINELLTNSIKHAFQDFQEKNISMKLIKNELSFIIDYQDNGSPKKDFDAMDKGFGLQLLKMLTEQMNGSMTVQADPGLHYQISFPFSFT